MITAIREVRRATGLTLDEVARRCVPPTTAQTIGRLETGARTVSLGWLNRIAAALGVSATDLVRSPDRAELAVAAILDASGAHAPRHAATLAAPQPIAELVAVMIEASLGDYRSGDALWCQRLTPDAFATALNCDVLVPRPGERFLFGRLTGRDAAAGKLHIVPLGAGARQQVVADPAWIARAVTLIRSL